MESAVELRYISNISSTEELTDKILKDYLESLIEDKRMCMSTSAISKIVSKNLYMNMTISHTRARMQMIFISYESLLKRNGISWLLESN